MSWETIPFALVLVSLFFNHRYTRHFIAMGGGLILVVFHHFEFAQITQYDYYFGIGLTVINVGFVSWQSWLFIMPLNKKEKKIFQNYFQKHFSKENFKKLMKFAQEENKSGGTTIVKQGDEVDNMLMVIDGSAVVRRDGNIIARVYNGDFIGEMSFMSGKDATATVKTEVLTTYLIWEQDDLKALLDRNTSLLVQFNKAMEEQVRKKLIERKNDIPAQKTA